MLPRPARNRHLRFAQDIGTSIATSPQFAPRPRLPNPGIGNSAPNSRNSPFSSTILIRLLLISAFLVSLMQYWVNVENAGLVPIAIIYLAGFLAFVGKDRSEKLSRIFSGGGVLFLFALLSEVVSYFAGDSYSLQYGLLLIGIFLSARLIIMHIGLLQVVRCYTQSAIACTVIIIFAGRKQLSDYQGGANRFTGGGAGHPNLVGFTLASYFPLFVGLAVDLPRGKKRLFIGGLALVTIALLFTTGSRGSLGAVIIAILVTVLRFTVFNRIMGRVRLSGLQVVLILLAAIGAIYVLFHGTQLARTGTFIVTALQLNSQQRGIHSGFSGRTGIWLTSIHRLSGLQWLFGMGYRQGFVIDSGYVTILFDNGIIGGSVILGSMIRVFYWLWRSTIYLDRPGWFRYYLVLWSMMIIYFLNNITTRYLFSYGNQFSLLVIFMIVCRKEELLGTINAPRRILRRAMQRPAELVSVGAHIEPIG